MPTYHIYAKVVGSKYLGTVEAKSEDEAKEKAYELDACHISLCHQCAGQCEDAEVDEVTVQRDD